MGMTMLLVGDSFSALVFGYKLFCDNVYFEYCVGERGAARLYYKTLILLIIVESKLKWYGSDYFYLVIGRLFCNSYYYYW